MLEGKRKLISKFFGLFSVSIIFSALLLPTISYADTYDYMFNNATYTYDSTSDVITLVFDKTKYPNSDVMHLTTAIPSIARGIGSGRITYNCPDGYKCYSSALYLPTTDPSGGAQGWQSGLWAVLQVSKSNPKTDYGMYAVGANPTYDYLVIVPGMINVRTPKISNFDALIANLSRIKPITKNFGDINGELIFSSEPKNPASIVSDGAMRLEGQGLAGADSKLVQDKTDTKIFHFTFPNPSGTWYSYTNYQITMFGVKGGTNCITGQDGQLGSINPTNCQIVYTGYLNFQLSDQGGIALVTEKDSLSQSNLGLMMTQTAQKPIQVSATETSNSPFDEAISSMVKSMAGFLTTGLNWVGSSVDWLTTTYTQDIILGKADGSTHGVQSAWLRMRDTGLLLMVMALIIIAFANVVGVDLEQYGLNRMIPRIIISMIMAFGSWLIFVFFFDMTSVLAAQASSILSGSGGPMSVLQNITISTPDTGSVIGSIGGIILLLILCLAVWVCGLVLLFLLLVRVIFLAFLLCVAPLAFILNIMPFSANLYKQWWAEFWKWMFMGPVALVILALGALLATNMGLGTGKISFTGSEVTSTNGNGFLMGMLVLGASMYLAATLPLQWGGKIMQSWSKLGKGAYNNFMGGKYLKQGWQDFSKARAERGQLRYNELRSGIANKGGALGRAITGTNKAQAAAQKEAIDKTYESMYSKLDATELGKAARAGGRKGMAATKILQSKYGDGFKGWAAPGRVNADGKWNTDDPMERKQWEKDAKAAALGSYASMMASDRDFEKTVIADNPEMAMMVAKSTSNANLAGEVNSVNAGKSWPQKDRKQVGFVSDDFGEIKGRYTNNPAGWQSVSNIARGQVLDANGNPITGAEERTGLLMRQMQMSAYDAGQMVAAADLRKSWDEQVARGQTARILANADDKRRGTIDKFNNVVRF